jgi:hypothetical protein
VPLAELVASHTRGRMAHLFVLPVLEPLALALQPRFGIPAIGLLAMPFILVYLSMTARDLHILSVRRPHVRPARGDSRGIDLDRPIGRISTYIY